MSIENVVKNNAVGDIFSLSRLLIRIGHPKIVIDYDGLTQFIEGLRSELELVRSTISPAESDSVSLATKIAAKLDESERQEIALDGKWNLAYHAEKLILSLYSAERQKLELYRRLNECERIKAPFITFYQEQNKKLEEKNDTGEGYFNLLVSLVHDMQHHNSNKHIKMRYARHAIYRVGLAFGFALVFFLSTISLFHWT